MREISFLNHFSVFFSYNMSKSFLVFFSSEDGYQQSSTPFLSRKCVVEKIKNKKDKNKIFIYVFIKRLSIE